MSTLVETMIGTLVGEVYKAINNEAQFATNFSSQFEQMKKWLDKMQPLFNDVDNLKSKRESIKEELKNLREVIYEADNALTDCVVRKLYRENTFFVRFLFHDPLFSYRMGKKLVEINSEMKGLAESLKGSLGSSPNTSQPNCFEKDRDFMSSQNCKPPVTYGLENEITMLKERILGSSKGELEYIGIVGMGGLGKTTVAQKLFHDTQVIDHFSKMIWVSVSRNFSVEEIVKRMLEKADVSESDSSSMLSSLQRGLEDHTYLIVMDDVWGKPNLKDWWSQFFSKLPKKEGKKSCIIITTREVKVAEDMVQPRHMHSQIRRPDPLNENDSWSLFSEYAFPETNENCPNYEQLKVEGEQILKKCGGLPLAIKTIGGFLAEKNGSLLEWERTRKAFHALTTDGKTDAITLSLQLSYDELPTRLKQCLLCVSIYPEDFEIHAEQLIHWWIADGLVQGKGSKTAIDMGYQYLAELVNRCLVEVVERRGFDGRIYKCKIHDMVRELIIKIAEDEAFCSFNDQGMQILKEDSRWLCFTDYMNADDHEMPLKGNSKLRALFLMSSPPNNFFKNFELESLRVLDLSYSKLDAINVKDSSTVSSEDLFNWISCLKRLACLNLSGVQRLREIPSSIRKLLNIQFLILNGCNDLVTIHPAITSLKRLIVLDLGACPLKYLPLGLGRLSHLQELSGFKVVSQATTRGSCGLLELGKLTELRVLRMIICDATEISRAEMDILSSLKKLKVLTIDAEGCKEKALRMLDDLKLPEDLQELYLRNYQSETMPDWFNPRMLPSLQYLCVENCQDLASLTHDKYTWKIEGLCMKLLSLEVDLKDLEKVMPALCYMEISNCFKLKGFPGSVNKPGLRVLKKEQSRWLIIE